MEHPNDPVDPKEKDMPFKTHSWLLVPAILAAVSGMAGAVVTESKVGPEYLARHAEFFAKHGQAFRVKTAGRDGNIEFTISRSTARRWATDASLVIRKDNREVVRCPLRPSGKKTDTEAVYTFVVSPDYLSGSEFVLSEGALGEADGRDVRLPGARIWRFQLAAWARSPFGPKIKPLGEGLFEVTITYRPTERAEAVYLAGSFNDWKPTAHKMEGPDAQGRFTTRLKLQKGRYEYKFVLDGQTWQADPENVLQAGFYRNSVLHVGVEP